MAKRYLWVVEWKDDGVWIPLAMDGDWTRRHARRYASDLRKSSRDGDEYRVRPWVRYSAEDTRG